METALRTGMALFNVGAYHEAHDPWEERWLELTDGSADERLLHGLIQYTAAVHHAHHANWEGVVGLATGALDYLSAVPPVYRDVDCSSVRSTLRRLADDPEWIERARVPPMRLDGAVVTPGRLSAEERCLAAEALAEHRPAPERRVVEEAIACARADREAGRSPAPFERLLVAYLRDHDRPAIVLDRLRAHLRRRRERLAGVADLFDP